MNRFLRPAGRIIAIALACTGASAWAQVASYDGASKLLSIPSMSIGGTTFTNLVYRNTGNFTFVNEAMGEQKPVERLASTYNVSDSVLTIPAVQVGTTTFYDVKLRNVGDFVFALQDAKELPAATVNKLEAFVAGFSAQWATEVPATSASRFATSDSCFASNGRTLAWSATENDENLQDFIQRDAYLIGSQRVNRRILAVRDMTNPDGSSRQEIDIQYDVQYKDGTAAIATPNTVITGSSAGTPGCATSQTSSEFRFLGNQRLVSLGVRPRNQRDERHSLTTGALLSPGVNYRRSVRWAINDPMGNSTYVVVTGPGPKTTVVNKVQTPFTLKFISPRIMRNELVAKNGGFVNWPDNDSFRYCRVIGANVPSALTANCADFGATALDYGVTTETPNTDADKGFTDLGFVAGGVYRYDVYNDDGWKVTNGHANKTPIATYYSTLEKLPYSFEEVAGGGVDADKFPRVSINNMTAAQAAKNGTSSLPNSLAVSWTTHGPWSDGAKFGLLQGSEFHQGAKIGNPGGAFNPGYRSSYLNYPGSLALSNPSWAVHPKLADQLNKSYFEFQLFFTDRSGHELISLISFQ